MSLSAVKVRSHSFVMCCLMGLPLQKTNYNCMQMQRLLHRPHLKKRYIKTTHGLTQMRGRREDRWQKRLIFSEWVAGELNNLEFHHILACSMCKLCVCVFVGEKGRGRQRQKRECNSSLKGQIPGWCMVCRVWVCVCVCCIVDCRNGRGRCKLAKLQLLL